MFSFWQLVAVLFILLAYRYGEKWLEHRERLYVPRDPTPEPLPLDLVNMAMLYGESWAQEQTMDAMREDFHRLGTWDAVRTKYSKMAPTG